MTLPTEYPGRSAVHVSSSSEPSSFRASALESRTPRGTLAAEMAEEEVEVEVGTGREWYSWSRLGWREGVGCGAVMVAVADAEEGKDVLVVDVTVSLLRCS